MTPEQISLVMSHLAKKSKAAQVKKYGGIEGYRKEMQRRGGFPKPRKALK